MISAPVYSLLTLTSVLSCRWLMSVNVPPQEQSLHHLNRARAACVHVRGALRYVNKQLTPLQKMCCMWTWHSGHTALFIVKPVHHQFSTLHLNPVLLNLSSLVLMLLVSPPLCGLSSVSYQQFSSVHSEKTLIICSSPLGSVPTHLQYLQWPVEVLQYCQSTC